MFFEIGIRWLFTCTWEAANGKVFHSRLLERVCTCPNQPAQIIPPAICSEAVRLPHEWRVSVGKHFLQLLRCQWDALGILQEPWTPPVPNDHLTYAPEWQLSPTEKFKQLAKEHLPPQIIVATNAPRGDLAALLDVSARVVDRLATNGVDCRPGIYLRMLGMFTLLFDDIESGLKALDTLGSIEGVVDFDVDTVTYIDYPIVDPFDMDDSFEFPEEMEQRDKVPIFYHEDDDAGDASTDTSATPNLREVLEIQA